MKKPLVIFLLVALHVIVGISALAGGSMLVINPDGSLLGMQPGWLNHSGFTTYLIPGLLLFFANGVFPLLTAAGLLFKPKMGWINKVNLYNTRHWAWACSLYTGVILIAWIIVQQVIANYFWLQPVIASAGLLIIVFTLLPAVTDHYSLTK